MSGFPCIKCKKDCTDFPRSIECSNCQDWIHRQCVSLTEEQFSAWSAEDLTFVCARCAFTANGTYDFHTALKRMYDADLSHRQAAARSERLLLDTYSIECPPINGKGSSLEHAKSDYTAEQILKIFHPAKLQAYKPLQVQADGNCFYRAVSLGCFGTERFHTLLRLLSGIEVLLHPTVYDISHNEYIDIFEDTYLAHYPYDQLCESILKDGAYSCMLTVACTSSVIGKGIMTYCPPTAVPKLLSNPLTKEVRGRGVKGSCECVCTVMWSMMTSPKKFSDFQPNHFVLLCGKSEIPNVFIDLLDDGYEGHGGVDDEHQIHISTNDINDGLLDNPHTYSDTNDEGSHDELIDNPHKNSDTNDEGIHHGLLDDPHKNSDTNDEGSHDGLIDDPQTNSDTINDEGVREGCNVADGQPLLNNAFMNLERLILCLSENENTHVYKELPQGGKNNCFFIIDNTENTEKRKRGDKSAFWDDRGAWTKGVTNKSLFVRKEDEPMRKVVVKNGIYHYESERQQCKKKIYIPLTTQPNVEDVLVLHRYYVKHTADETFQKRVSWLGNDNAHPVAVYEYKGVCPSLQPHGRKTTGNTSAYVRLTPRCMQEIKHGVLTKTPAEIYDQTTDGNRLTDGVRNKRQIINAKSRVQQQSGTGCDVGHKKNFADQVAGVENLQNSLPFVKAVIREHGKVPCIILYEDQQIQDILRFCCPPVTCRSTVLSFDKTFNLGQVHVTLAVYKNLSVYRRTTNNHPVFCGPMFLHGESDVTTFFTFFHHLKGQMILSQGNEKQTLPALGSDEEKAMRIGMAKAFPDSQRLACVRHIEKNLLAFMQDKIGMSQNQRRELKKPAFPIGYKCTGSYRSQ